MKRSIVLFLGAFAIVAADRASAQEVAPGPGTVEVTIMPASKDDAPAFFGKDDRYGHRVYGAVIVNMMT
jgi:hypothetical protein